MDTRTLALGICLSIIAISLVSNLSFSSDAEQLKNQNKALTDQIASIDRQLLDVDQQTASLQNQKASLEDKISVLKNEVAVLQNETAELQLQLEGNMSQTKQLEQKVGSLNAQVDYFRNKTLVLFPWEEAERSHILANTEGEVPVLITRLGATEFRDVDKTPRVYVAGYVYNVGTAEASNARLRVVLYQGNIVAANVTIPLGTIGIYNQAFIKENVYYVGSPVSRVEILREFD